MQTTQTLKDDNVSVSLSFELHLAVESPSSEDLTTPDELEATGCPLAQGVLQMATASAPLLLQAFEKAQLTVAHSLASLSLAQLNLLQANSSAAAAKE
ncbi:MAG: hypothetical protein Q8R67_08100 [Rhodoferax sp.]|nr:hypothetical protein [Rhodoferax sp.]MDP3651630.1 hypothetical protein [Rhodoferax sp.]